MTRPEPPNPAPDGYRWTVVPAAGWRIDEGRRCRGRLPGSKHTMCPERSVAALNRGWSHAAINRRVASWWAYCPSHLAGYRKWIEDGQVLAWKLEGTKP